MSRQAEAGIVDGKLRPCPDSPNCVCSEFTGSSHSIAPLSFNADCDGAAESAWTRLLDILASQPRTTIVDQDAYYVQVRVRTRLFRFEDVLEFRLDETAGEIHVRSASETGYSDFGVNRRRVEAIRRLYNADGSTESS
jgi:uncharacterized protein (DUF1499 family)